MAPAVRVRRLRQTDLQAVVELSLEAWAPVHESFRLVLGDAVFSHVYPDWRASQAAEVEAVCADAGRYTVLVASVAADIAGYVAYEIDRERATGEITLLAVLPRYQNRGIGTRLNTRALRDLREAAPGSSS